jgi:hypothetical protein
MPSTDEPDCAQVEAVLEAAKIGRLSPEQREALRGYRAKLQQVLAADQAGPVSEEFQTACSLWRMEFGFHTFQAVRAGIEKLLEHRWHSDQPEYCPMLVGLICLYARPFTNNRPVGPLPEEIVPEEHLSLHRDIILMRHKLFAHGDASAMTRPDDYPNELVFVNDSKGTNFHMTRFFAEPPFFELIIPLVETLIQKTRYHADKLSKRFNRHFSPTKNIGEFRLNVLDPTAPIFSKLTEAEKVTRQATIRSPRTSNANPPQ